MQSRRLTSMLCAVQLYSQTLVAHNHLSDYGLLPATDGSGDYTARERINSKHPVNVIMGSELALDRKDCPHSFVNSKSTWSSQLRA